MDFLALDPATTVLSYGAPAHLKPTAAPADRARTQADNFETMFLNSMLQHMFTATGKDGPLGGGQAVGAWRSMLTEQYAKSIVKAGGLGIANQVYKSMMARQTAKPAT